MAKIAFLLLCHRDPQAIAEKARELVAGGDAVAIHYDARAPLQEFEQLRAALADEPSTIFTARRIKCGWGEWSLVEATLETARTALAAFPDATHLYMISGDCGAIKSAEYAHRLLDSAAADHIESHDFFESDWIRTGLREERLIYRHWFNERRSRSWFYWALELQKRLGLRRPVPPDLRIMIGSQWWCLRRATVEQVLAFTAERPDLVAFFKSTWIPDETFFQTLVRHLVPDDEIRNRSLTFLLFTDYGMPATFYNDHYDLLLAQDSLFARKISREARDLRTRLGALYASGQTEFQVSDEGRRLFAFLTNRGRVGRRFAPRFWEDDAGLNRDKALLLVVCKKWHIARRLAQRIEMAGLMPALGYVFDDADCALPDLGGIGASLDKRHRHRRALVHLLFECFGCDRVMLCVDPGRRDMLLDFAGTSADLRVLEVYCTWSDREIADHARRTGLAGPATSPDALAGLVDTLRTDLRHESDALSDSGFKRFERIAQDRPATDNALSLARFLSISETDVSALLESGDLFDERPPE